MKKVKDLIKWLEGCDPEAPVRMCMDWTKIENGPKGQWEDDLGDLATSTRTDSKGKKSQTVYLLNENFK